MRIVVALVLVACGTPAAPPPVAHVDTPVRNLPPPVVAVVPAPPADAGIDPYDTLRQSGPAAEDWDAQGLSELATIAPPPIQSTNAACFVAGCGTTLDFPSLASYQQCADRLAASPWTGGKLLTEAMPRAGGHVTASLILYRPD